MNLEVLFEVFGVLDMCGYPVDISKKLISGQESKGIKFDGRNFYEQLKDNFETCNAHVGCFRLQIMGILPRPTWTLGYQIPDR